MHAHRIPVKQFSLVLVVVLIAFCIGGCSKKGGKSSYDYFSQAQQYYQNGQRQAAIIELKNALQEDPNNGEARYLYAVVHNDLGEGAEAEIELHKALKLGVNKAKVDAALGRAYLLQKKYQKILDEVNPTEHMKGEQVSEIYTVRGDAYLGLGKEVEAKSSFDQAIKLSPDSAGGYLGLARLAEAHQDLKEALRQTEVALSKSPKNALGWLMKANLLRMQHKNEEAKAAYQHILKIDKGNMPAHLGLATMALTAGSLDEATSELDAARKVAPKSLEVKYTQALLSFREGKYADARDSLQDVMRIIPNYMPGVLLSGAVSYQLGSYEQAHQYLTTFLGQFPENAYATNLLAATDLQLKQPEKALQNLGPLLAKEPRNPQVLALAGEAYLQSKNYSRATSYLERAASLDSKNAALQTQLGFSHLVSGDTRQAIADLESAAAIDPHQSKANALLVLTHMHNGEYQKALAAAQAWEKKNPDNPVVYNLEGSAYVGQKEFAKARKHFEKALEIEPKYFPAVANLAQLDMHDKKPQEARKRLKEYLKTDKANLSAMVALANVAAATGHKNETEEWLNKAVQAHPSVIQVQRVLVNYYLRGKEFQKALSAAQAAQNANADDPDVLDMLASTQVSVGMSRKAIDSYKRLTQLVPNSPIVRLKLADAYMGVNEMAAARKSINEALKINPNYIGAEIKLISLNLKDKKYVEAMNIANHVQKQFPQDSIGQALAGDILSAQHQYALAVKHYRQAFDIQKNGLLAVKLHQALVLSGDEKGADRMLLQWLDKKPNDNVTRTYLADYYLKTGKNVDAIKQYQILVNKVPGNVMILNNLAWLYQQQRDPRALDIAEKAYRLNPNSVVVMDTLGWILTDRGDTHRAVDLLKKASTSVPQALQIRYHYAVALAKSGNAEEARKELKQIVDSGRDFPDLRAAKALLSKL